MKKLIKRVCNAYRLIKEDYVMWLEDDVLLKGKITDTFEYDMNGQSFNNINHIRMDDVIKDFPFIDKTNIYFRNGQGGTVFHKEKCIQYFENEVLVNKILDKYESYSCPWYQDFLFSFIVILSEGTIGPYYGHGDTSAYLICDHLCVQHLHKEYYNIELPDGLRHLVRGVPTALSTGLLRSPG